MRIYTSIQKDRMREEYRNGSTYGAISRCFGCAVSTVFYAVNPEAYEKHKEHVNYMKRLKKGGAHS